MRHATKIVLVACLLLIAACAKSPETRWLQADTNLAAVEKVLLDLHATGTLSDGDMLAADVPIQAARSALGRADGKLPKGGADFEAYLRIVQDARMHLHDTYLLEINR